MNTSITDRAAYTIGDQGELEDVVPIETARTLERMCGELARCAIDGDTDGMVFALAKWQAMKDEATK